MVTYPLSDILALSVAVGHCDERVLEDCLRDRHQRLLPALHGGDSADEREADGRALGARDSEVDQVARSSDVRDEDVDCRVEVHAPGVVYDNVDAALKGDEGLRGKAEVCFGGVTIEEHELSGREESSVQALILERCDLPILGGTGFRQAVEGVDAADRRIAEELGEEVGAEGTRGTRKEHYIIRRERC
jgi:hypothetical protein